MQKHHHKPSYIIGYLQEPPDGHCTLYALYAKELSRSLGYTAQTICPDENHEHSTPGLLINRASVSPAVGVIIDVGDICNTIKQLELEIEDLSGLRNRLEFIVEEALANM